MSIVTPYRRPLTDLYLGIIHLTNTSPCVGSVSGDPGFCPSLITCVHKSVWLGVGGVKLQHPLFLDKWKLHVVFGWLVSPSIRGIRTVTYSFLVIWSFNKLKTEIKWHFGVERQCIFQFDGYYWLKLQFNALPTTGLIDIFFYFSIMMWLPNVLSPLG